VAIQCVASILDDDVGVGLEDRDQLLVGRHGFTEDDTAMRLRHHTSSESNVVLQRLHQLDELGLRALLRWGLRRHRCGDALCRVHGLVRDLEQVPIQRHTILLGTCIQDREPSTLRKTLMACERSLDVLLCSGHEPRQNANRVHE
jgi:hypothetical protein